MVGDGEELKCLHPDVPVGAAEGSTRSPLPLMAAHRAMALVATRAKQKSLTDLEIVSMVVVTVESKECRLSEYIL